MGFNSGFKGLKASSSVSKKFLLTVWNDGVVLIKKYKSYIGAMKVEKFSGRM